LQKELDAGLDPTKRTVAEQLQDWVDREQRAGEVSASTINSHRYAVRRISDHLGTVPLSKLTTAHVETMLDTMATEDASAETLRRMRMVLVRALEDAVARDYVLKNRAKYARLPKSNNDGRPSKAMTAKQLPKFLKAIRATEDEALWLTMVGCGLRPGEACGLRWEDLELDGDPPLLDVRQARLHQPDGTMTFGDPKTKGSVRTLVLPEPVVAALRRHQVRQKEARLKAGSLWADHGLVFPDAIGDPITSSALAGRFRRATGAAGLPGRWHPHELKHTWNSRCDDAGISAQERADAMGHTGIGLAQGTYRHRDAPAGSSAAAVMDDLLS
jgi:integrase